MGTNSWRFQVLFSSYTNWPGPVENSKIFPQRGLEAKVVQGFSFWPQLDILTKVSFCALSRFSWKVKVEQLFPIEREGFFLIFARIILLKLKWTFQFQRIILKVKTEIFEKYKSEGVVVLQILPWRMQRARQYNLRKHYNATFCLWVKSTHPVYPHLTECNCPEKSTLCQKSQRGKRSFGEASTMAFLKMRGFTVDIHNWFSLFWFLVPMRGEVFIPSDNNSTQHYKLTIFINLNKPLML